MLLGFLAEFCPTACRLSSHCESLKSSCSAFPSTTMCFAYGAARKTTVCGATGASRCWWTFLLGHQQAQVQCPHQCECASTSSRGSREWALLQLLPRPFNFSSFHKRDPILFQPIQSIQPCSCKALQNTVLCLMTVNLRLAGNQSRVYSANCMNTAGRGSRMRATLVRISGSENRWMDENNL